MYKVKAFFLILLLFTLPSYAGHSLKDSMLRDLEHIQQTFSVKYAPLLWKESYKGWLLDEEMKRAKAKIQRLQHPTIREFQKIVSDFFQTTADYHVQVSFYATASSILDFTLKSAEGRYFIVDIDRTYLPTSKFPCNIGDEVLSFNGIPIAEAVKQFKKTIYIGGNTPETDQALAEQSFTKRFASEGHPTPKGSAQIETRNKEGMVRLHKLNWDHQEERIGDPAFYQTQRKGEVEKSSSSDNFLTRKMCTPLWSPKKVRSKQMSSHEIGARSSFLSKLGVKLWSTASTDFFDSYIFTSPQGHRLGYVRIAHYMSDVEEVEEFEKLIKKMESSTDALIIDQLNNPGGSVFYLYTLASLLSNKPLHVPKHHISLTQDDLFTAMEIADSLEGVEDLEEIQEVIGDNFDGYPVTEKFAEELQLFAKDLLKEWNAGRMVTQPLYLLGVKEIQPYPSIRYTKPIVLLINSLDFSGGDFFPAILQDNKRALIVGTRTAGAGGYVLKNEFYNRSSIESFSVTGSLAIRHGGDPLENLGVEPDISLDLTAYDMQNDYKEYKEKLLFILDWILENR